MSTHTFADDFAEAQARFGLEESDQETFGEIWGMNRHRHDEPGFLEQTASFARLLRTSCGDTMPEANPGPAPTGRPGPPRQLDEEGQRLYREIEALADRKAVGFFDAMAELTGVSEYADRAPRPLSAKELEELGQGVDPESRVTDQAAQVLQRSHAIDYADASEVVELTRGVAEAKADTGAADVPWHDTRVLKTPPVPWSNDDWERDRRRAAAAGIDLTREGWEATAEEGRDAVGEQAEEARRERIEDAEKHLARIHGSGARRRGPRRARRREQR